MFMGSKGSFTGIYRYSISVYGLGSTWEVHG